MQLYDKNQSVHNSKFIGIHKWPIAIIQCEKYMWHLIGQLEITKICHLGYSDEHSYSDKPLL